MTNRFKALVLTQGDDGRTLCEERVLEASDLMDGDVDVAVEATTVNYKDGLAITGRSPVVRRWPMVPGVDLAGTVTASRSPLWREGDRVILNGWGVGETHYGAYAGLVRVKAEWLVALPERFSFQEAMAIGTAGYTAMLALLALERFGVSPDHGPALVTGAAGGVGSVAVSLLAGRGWHVVASTGRPAEAGWLGDLGAAEVVDRSELSASPKPLARERWAAGIDSVGGTTLANALAATRRQGAIAACGLAGGMELPGSVAPFILRGVALLGIDSVMAPRPLREEAWARLAADLAPGTLAHIEVPIGFADIVATAHAILEGRVRGRVVVTDVASATRA
ncbi:MDR family oxidoreductase [Aureimonas jatrophae]|uniref:Acrylyl-CoA reductase (NADPH) n=1 Tax=Aureimonas jatrophae TaxID=1166073 RepID=A0A1H0ILU9_9HYPH|nr:MDR family oxidoreductase [Aureimonas jatrophae]MBB3952247.1 acrylyl-CoA reductase (NADPH) [Aureimonas jatrophae]SDO32368.1 acrylyl-CoA reductase (NADPH) [Aureimonas jatrophae]